MPIYESQDYSRDELWELRKRNKCATCGAMLNVFLDVDKGLAYLACNSDHAHEGIEREAGSPLELNIPSWREEMEGKHGKETTSKLEIYRGVTTLAKEEALSLFDLLWPEAPYNERMKAAIICHQYGLNPLMKHIALLKFNKYNKKHEVVGERWAIVQEIASNRIIAQRRHHYSYLDMSPRRMTDDEQMKINGEIDKTRIWAITLLKDLNTGAEFTGTGSWPLDEEPYGVEKGNSHLNMAKIRSERNALDRAYPAELPQGVEVIEEQYTEAPLLAEGDEKTGEHRTERGRGGETAQTIFSSPKDENITQTTPTVPVVEGQGFTIDLPWLKETQKQLKWSDDTMMSFIAAQYKVQGQNITEALGKLTKQQAEQFTRVLQDKLSKKQAELF